MRIAFKEWAVVVDALGRGEQIIILRKGGINESLGGFKLEHSRFLLFPTLFHQQRGSVIASAQNRYDEIAPHFPTPEILRLEFFAEVVTTKWLNSQAEATTLRGQHVWREELIAQRCGWGRDRGILALGIRVFQLLEPVVLPVLPAYGGCKSWVELDREIDSEGAHAVLTDAAFSSKLKQFNATLTTVESSMPSPVDAPQAATTSPSHPVSAG